MFKIAGLLGFVLAAALFSFQDLRLIIYEKDSLLTARGQALVTAGLPFARGEISSLSQIALFNGTGALQKGGYPGVIYDEANDRFLVFFNETGRIAVYRVHPETWAIDQPAVAGTRPATRDNGIHNSVQYVPELGGFVIANTYNGNVFFMRTSSGTKAEVVPVSARAGLWCSPNPVTGSTVISLAGGFYRQAELKI